MVVESKMEDSPEELLEPPEENKASMTQKVTKFRASPLSSDFSKVTPASSSRQLFN